MGWPCSVRRWLIAAGALAGATLFMGAPPARAAEAHVTIVDFAFSPADVTVEAGDTVVWTNTGAAPHTSTSDSGQADAWDSGTLTTGQQFSRTFATPGTFTYFCAIHPFMRGTVTVRAQPTATPSPTATATATPASPSPTPPPTETPAPSATPTPVTPSPSPVPAEASGTAAEPPATPAPAVEALAAGRSPASEGPLPSAGGGTPGRRAEPVATVAGGLALLAAAAAAVLAISARRRRT